MIGKTRAPGGTSGGPQNLVGQTMRKMLPRAGEGPKDLPLWGPGPVDVAWWWNHTIVTPAELADEMARVCGAIR